MLCRVSVDDAQLFEEQSVWGKKGGTMGKSSIAIDVVHKKQESLSASCCDR